VNTSEQDSPSTRPYLIRALHEWCSDNGYSPYLAVQVDASVQVPMDFVKNGEIVLNVGVDATSNLRLGNDFVEFKARFGGVSRDIVVPISHVVAIYARENGQGMAFPAPSPRVIAALGVETGLPEVDDSSSPGGGSVRPPLRAVPTESAGEGDGAQEASDDTPPDSPPPRSGRPVLKRVK
jgi:stringent starvation protein B